jgi:hypothetical protein
MGGIPDGCEVDPVRNRVTGALDGEFPRRPKIRRGHHPVRPALGPRARRGPPSGGSIRTAALAH